MARACHVSSRAMQGLTLSLFLICCSAFAQDYDVVLRSGVICDGTGQPCTRGGIAISGDRIVKVGDVSSAHGKTDLDVHGQVIAPGFINMMSGPEPLFADGRGLSDIMQGVTLEIFGEGESMGPVNEDMRAEDQAMQGDIKFPITWNTLAEGLET